MHTASPIANGYLRRVYVAAALRSARSLLRALMFFMLATGMVGLAVAALGWAAR